MSSHNIAFAFPDAGLVVAAVVVVVVVVVIITKHTF